MKFKNILSELNEAYEVGPATNLENLARRVLSYKNKEQGLKWATREIRDLFKRMSDGNGRTAHDNINDLTALTSALSLYIEDDIDEKMKDELKISYSKVLQRIRKRNSR